MERTDQVLRIAPDYCRLLEPGLDRMVVSLAHNRFISLGILQSRALSEGQVDEQLGIQIRIGRAGVEETKSDFY